MSAAAMLDAYERVQWDVAYPQVAEFVPAWRLSPDFVPWKPRTIPWEQCSPARRAALRRAWKRGDLSYKLDPEQARVYRKFREWLARPTHGRGRRGKKYSFDVGRRWGKSTIAFLIAVEERIRQPKRRRIAYWCDTAQMCREIIMLEIFPMIFADCPPEMMPEWFPSRNRIVWRRDHRNLDQCRSLELAGLDKPNRARGRSLFFGVLDECGFMPKLEYIDKSIVSKQQVGVQGAALLFASSPPETPSHYLSDHIVPMCKQAGAYHHGTIFDSMRLSDEEIITEVQESGGFDATAVQRELLAQHITEAQLAVLPEAVQADDSGQLAYVGTLSPWRLCVTAMDPGWSDETGLIFASVDFERDEVVIEDAWSQAQAPSSVVADVIREREKALWSGVHVWSKGGSKPNPLRRFTDVDKRMVGDLSHDHKLAFTFSRNDSLGQQVNRVRNWLMSGRLRIHPGCNPDMAAQMRKAVWKNHERNQFARVGAFGHFDLVAALTILCRNIEPLMARNPNPPARVSPATHHVPKELLDAQAPAPAIDLHQKRSDRTFERVRNRRQKRAASGRS